MVCKYCDSANTNDDVGFCPVCGKTLLPDRDSEAVCVSRNASAAWSSLAGYEPFAAVAAPEDIGAGEKVSPMPFESLLAKLDLAERDIFSHLEEEQRVHASEAESEVTRWDDKEDNLASLSTALDGLLAGLLDTVEMEGERTPAPGERMAALPKGGWPLTDSPRNIALVTVVFFLGMAVGLLVSGLLGR